MKIDPHVALLILAALVLICATVLAALGNPIPNWFESVAAVAVGGAAGVAVQSKAQ